MVTAAHKRASSMRDVARLAGVSHQTVSRVLNEHPSVRDSTRQRVLVAIDELQYRPNRAARALVTRRSRLIGLLIAKAGSHYGPVSSVRAIQNAARDAGYAVTTANLESTGHHQIVRTVDQLLAQGVEGIVVIAPQTRVLDAVASEAWSVPFVTMQASNEGRDGPLWWEQFAAARRATGYLIELGHTRIRHVAGPSSWMEAQARLAGYRAQMKEKGLTPAEPAVGDWTSDSGYEAGRRLIAEGGFTAVFSSNDQMALGLIHALHDAGFDVPHQISVIGFDDIPEARHFHPPLTTMRQDFDELGKRSITTLIHAIEHPGAHTPACTYRVEPRLVPRASTAPCNPVR
jgi:DNA-binding LacI/PurR family transcriptional regulator